MNRLMLWWARHGGIAQFHRPSGPAGHVAGWTMAHRRNRTAIRAGRVRLLHAAAQNLTVPGAPFDAALAVNTIGMWPDPPARLRELAQLLRPGGRIALVSQPRCPGATAATSAAAAAELTTLLTKAGYTDLRTDFLNLNPPAACVQARRPT
jgi:SAM-dependent methyltransferase